MAMNVEKPPWKTLEPILLSAIFDLYTLISYFDSKSTSKGSGSTRYA